MVAGIQSMLDQTGVFTICKKKKKSQICNLLLDCEISLFIHNVTGSQLHYFIQRENDILHLHVTLK